MGTLIAWVLVRDRFWGKRILDVIIDIPFALPTIVAGLVLLGLYGNNSPIGLDWAYTERAVMLALRVRDAAVHRPHGAAGARGARPRRRGGRRLARRAAGCTIFRRIILPSLVPAIAAGAALSFARAIAEYGSLVLLSGNKPFATEVVSVRVLSFIENGSTARPPRSRA